MKKRPLSIVIIAAGYLLGPLVSLLTAARANDLALIGPGSIFSRLVWSDGVILALFPLVAVGIYQVKRWGWYLFTTFSVVLIGYSIYVYRWANPTYDVRVAAAFILLTSTVTAMFLRRHVYAPYFNPRMRWWEVPARYRIRLDTRLLLSSTRAARCHTYDISRTGCFIDYDRDLRVGEQVLMAITCMDQALTCIGRVVRKAALHEGRHGYGIMFQDLPRDTRCRLRLLLEAIRRIGGQDRGTAVDALRRGRLHLQSA